MFLRTLLCAAAGIVVSAAAMPAPASAQTMASEAALRRTIYVPRDKTLSFRLAQPAARIVIAQPDIAKVTATSDRSSSTRAWIPLPYANGSSTTSARI